MYQPHYYLGRRVEVMHPKSHPVTYVYTFARFESRHGNRHTVLKFKAENYGRRERGYGA